MRLGDLDALEKRMNERLNFLRKAYGEHDDYTRGFNEGCVAVENAPTIDPKNLSPHGRWIWELADNGWANYICSNCGYTRNVDVHIVMDWGYCPVCGCCMDGGDGE